jgi:hypothetical protein
VKQGNTYRKKKERKIDRIHENYKAVFVNGERVNGLLLAILGQQRLLEDN